MWGKLREEVKQRISAGLLLATVVGAIAGWPRPGWGAVALVGNGRLSARNVATLSTSFTIANAPDTVLVAAIDLPEVVTVQQLSWNGTPLVRLSGQSAGPGTCKVETWLLRAPTPGNHDFVVTLDRNSAFAIGAAAFSGVDRARGPVPAVASGVGTQIAVTAPEGPFAGVFASACASGRDNRGAAPAAGQIVVLNSAEPDLVSVAGYRLTQPWNVSWTLQAAAPWAAASVLLVDPAAAVTPVPDSGSPPDTASPPDVEAPAQPDASSDQIAANPDVADAPDLGTRVDVDAPAFDGPINLHVGCACDVARARGASAPATLWGLGIAVVLRRLQRRRYDRGKRK
jgi:hypothetical protein